MRIFIGLTGVKTAGKTTAFNYLKELNPSITEVTLAARLKKACEDCLGVPHANLHDPALKEVDLTNFVQLDAKNVTALYEYFGKTPDYDTHVRPHIGVVFQTGRRAAQYVGTEILRSIDENIHCVGATLDLPMEGVFVITDMRFRSEFDYFNDNYPSSFFPVYIKNDKAEHTIDDHPSEKEVLKIAPLCVVVNNNGTLEQLKNNINTEYESIMRRCFLINKAGVAK